MTFWGLVLTLFIAFGAAGATGLPFARRMPISLAVPGAWLGAIFGYFYQGIAPRVAGVPIVPVIVGALLFSGLVRLLAVRYREGYFRHPLRTGP
jgi:hypothetical protein